MEFNSQCLLEEITQETILENNNTPAPATPPPHKIQKNQDGFHIVQRSYWFFFSVYWPDLKDLSQKMIYLVSEQRDILRLLQLYISISTLLLCYQY